MYPPVWGRKGKLLHRMLDALHLRAGHEAPDSASSCRHAPGKVASAQRNIARLSTTPSFFRLSKVSVPVRRAATMRRALFTPTPGTRSRVSSGARLTSEVLDPKCNWALNHMEQFPVESRRSAAARVLLNIDMKRGACARHAALAT